MHRWSFCLGAAALLVGCLSADKRVAEQLPAVQRDWQAQVQLQANLPVQTLDWPQAVTRVRTGNLKLRAARLEVTNAQESVRQVYKDLMPTLNLRSGVSRTLGGLPDISPSDVTFSADGLINVPGLASLSRRRFTAQLTLLRAESAVALQERTAILELFKLFPRSVFHQERLAQLAALERAVGDWLALDPALGTRTLAELTAERAALVKEDEALNLQTGELLGDRSHRWRLVTNGLPVLDYATLPLGDTNRVGRLQMRLVAIELAGALARQQGIKLQYWPELYLFVTGPPVYQRVAGTDRFWDVEQVRLSADLFWQVDTRGNIARQLRQEQRQQELQRDRLRQESQALIAKLLTAQQLLQTAREQEARLVRQTQLLAGLPAPQDFPAWLQMVSARRTSEQERQKLRLQSDELQTLFWFLDDENWQAGTVVSASGK